VRKRLEAEAAAEAGAAEAGAAEAGAAEAGAAEAGAAAAEPVGSSARGGERGGALRAPRKQLQSVAAPRGWRGDGASPRGGLSPPSDEDAAADLMAAEPAAKGGRAADGKKGSKGKKAAENGKRGSKLVPYAKHVLGLQAAQMEAALAGQKREREAPEASDVYERTRAMLSFLPPELAEGVARVRARGGPQRGPA